MKRLSLFFGFLIVCFSLSAQVLDVLNEDFDDVSLNLPDGWDNSDNTLSNPMYNWSWYSPGYGGEGKCMRFNSYSTYQGEKSALKTPVFKLDRATILRFKFKNVSGGDFSVYLSLDGGATRGNLIESGLQATTWTEKEYTLAGYVGSENVCIIFVATSNNGNSDAFIYLDDVIVEDIPLCSVPKNLNLLSATDNSAVVIWDLSGIGGEPEKYRLQVTDKVQLITDTIEFETEDFMYELEGLMPNKDYELVLEAYCGLGKGWSDESEALEFKTLCETKVLPFSETFDAIAVGDIPNCWFGEGGEVCSEQVGSLKLNSTTTSGAFIVTPRLFHPANDLDIKMKIYGAIGTKFKVGLMSDPLLPETFEVLWVDSIKADETWVDYRRPSLTSVAYGATDNVSLAISLDAGVVSTLYIDSLSVSDAPGCMYLYDLRLVTSTATTVVVDWSEYIEAESYEYEIKVDGQEIVTNGLLSVVNGQYVIEGLTPSTEYKIRVRGVCGSDRGEWTDWIDVETVCLPRETATFLESFAKGGVPECWMVKQTVGVDKTGTLNKGDEGWSVTTTTANVYFGTAALWGRKAYKGIRTIVVSQAIDIERAGMYDMSFWVKRLKQTGSDVLQVWANNRPDTVGGVKLGVVHNGINESPVVAASGWYKYEYNIPLSGVTYIVLEMISNQVSQFYVDELEVYLAPTCRKVSDVKWVDETTTGGIVEWKKAADETAWIVNAQASSASGEVKEYQDTIWGTPQWVFSGLESGTDYVVNGEVMAYCGGEDKGESVSFDFAFMTDCEAFVDFPFAEGFEDGLFPPKCWEQWQIASPNGVDSTKQGWGRNSDLTNYIHRGSASAQLYNFSEGHKHLLVMPQMDFGEGGYRLTFWQYRNSGYTIKQLEGIRVLINDKPSTEGARELIYIKSNMLMYPEVYEAGFYKYKVDIYDTGKQYIMFEGVSENYTASFIDDVEISKIPECDEIGKFAVIDVLDTKISVKLSELGVGDNWQVSCGVGDFVAEDGIIVNGTDSVVEITGLESSTTYRLYARRVCGDKYGAWSEELVEVTTLCSPIVVNLENEWFEGFEDYAAGGGIGSCYIEERGTVSSRELKVVSGYNETDVYGEAVMYNIQPKTGNRFALTPEYNSDNWLFAHVELLAGENYELSLMARHGDPLTNIETKVSLAYGSRPMSDSMTTYIVKDYVVDGDWTSVVGSFAVEESGKYFVGIHLQVNNYYEKGALDDIRLRISNCVMPSLMSASRTTQSSVVLNVVSLSDSIRIAVSDRKFNPVSEQANVYDAVVLVSGTQYNITDLQPDTKYYYSVCGVCGEYESDWMRLDSFETRCLAVDVPLYESFEDAEGLGCWSVIGNGVAERATSSSYSGNCSYKMNGVTLISPEINVTSLADYMLTGKVYAVGEDVSFGIGVMTDPNEMESFEQISTFTVYKRTTWSEFFTFFSLLNSVDFESVKDAKYIAIVIPSDVDFYFDDLKIDVAVSCPNPTEPSIANITTTSCDISWMVNGDETQWNVTAYNADGALVVDTIVLNNSVTIGGLMPSTYYDFHVAALCSDIETSIITYAGGVRTLCKEIMPLPYSESFEGAEYVSDLCFSYINKKAEWPAVELDKALFVMGGKQSLELIMSKTEPLCVIMPQFELPTNQLRISFDYRNETADKRWNTDLVLGVIRDVNDIATFDTLRVCPMSSDSTRVYYYFDSLPAELANARIALKYGPGPIDNRSCGIDNILVEAIPGCVEPAKEMEIVKLTDTSVTVKFDGRGASKFEYKVVNNGEIVMNNEFNNSEFTIQNLVPRTYYELYVRSVCSETNKSDWVGPLNFRTNCKDGLETPWLETFEDYSNISESCFITIGEEGRTNISLANGRYASKGDKGMLMSLGQYKEMYVVLPRFDAPISDLKLVFDYYSEEHDGVTADLILGVMSDISDKLTFKQVMAYGTTNGYVTTYQTFDNIGKEYENGWIVFKWCNFREEWASGPTYYAYCGLDNIKVEAGASCFEPEQFDLVNVTSNSAVVTWSHLEDVENAEYRLKVVGSQEEVMSGRVDTMRVELSGLNAGTNYMLSVRTMCNDTLYSDWVDFAFRTVPAPPALPYVVGFEDEAENENWTLVNGDQMNKLVIGSDEEAVLSGNKSLYVSHDGSDYFYYFNYASDVHAYRPIYLEAGEYLSEFSWKCAGEDTRDYGRLYLVPVVRDIRAGEYIATQAYVPEGCIAIDGGSHLNESADWVREVVEFSVKEAQFYNLVVSWHNNNSGGATPPFAIDDIVIREATCLPVDSLHIVAVDDRSVVVGVKNEETINVEWEMTNVNSEVVNSQLSTINSQLSIEGLAPETEYEFRVRVVCEEGDTSQWRSIAFKTEKRAVDAPYITGFENGEDNAGWTIVSRGNNAFIVGPTDEAVSSGDSALYVHSTQDSYAVSYNYVKNANYSYDTQYIYAYRLIRFEPGAYYIDYDWKCEGKENEDYGRVYLQSTSISQLAMDASVALDEGPLYGSLQWSRQGGILEVEDTTIYKLVVMWQNEVDGTYYTGPKPLAIDNIEVKKLDCEVVDSIRLVALGDTYAEVEFVNKSQTTDYRLMTADNTIIREGVVGEDRLRFDGLVNNTQYSLLLKTICDDGSESPTRELKFTTTKYQYSLPYETDFENEDDNLRWTFEQGIGSNKFVINSDMNAVNRGEKALYVSNGDSVYRYVDYERNIMAYVSLTFAEAGEYVVNYDWKAKGEAGSDYARVFLAPTVSGLVADTHYPYETLRDDFIAVDGGKGLCFDTAIWHNQTEVFVVEKPMNCNFVVTWHNDKYINGTPPISIDNIVVRKNSCKAVESIEIVDVQDVNATVKLTAENLSVVEYRVSLTYNPEEAFISDVASGNMIYINGLKPNATQYLFVRVKCSDADYSLWQMAEITTYCDDIITVSKTQPYIDNFEYSDLDPCWIVTKGGRSTGQISMLSSLETIVLKATNDVNVSLTRPFNLVAGRRYELSVKSRQRELLEDSRVGFVARRRGGDFDTLGQHQVTQAYEYYDATFTPTETGVYELGVWIFTPWWCNNSTTYLLTIDEFEVKEVLLAKPEEFAVDYLSSTSVDLSWKGDGLADSFGVQLLINGSVVCDTIVKDESISLVGLKNSTQYDARVRGLLTQAGDSSSWATLSFRTHCDIVNLPFRENFEEAGDNIPECWTLASNLEEAVRDWAVQEDFSGNRTATVNTSLAHGYAVLHTPLLFVDSDVYKLSFRYETTIRDDEYLVVRISDDAGATFGDTVLYATKNNIWTDVEYDLSAYAGKTIMIEFKVRSLRDNSYSESVKVDDIKIVCRSANEVVYTDHICWGNRYRCHGFDVDTEKLNFGLNRIEQLIESQVPGECDTMKVLNLTIDPAGTFYLNDTICPGDVYNKGAFDGYNLTDAGTYLSEPQISSCGCDSIVRLYLVVQPKRTITNDTICEGETYTFAGEELSATGIYVDTISYCEFSILNLVVHPKYFEHGDTICEGTILEWEGLTLTETGRYEKVYKNQYGCDSIEVMNLWVIPKRVEFATTICEGTTYYFGGKELSKPGVYVDSLVNMLGCDSIITLRLSVSEPSRSRFDDYVCEGYEYVGYGFRVFDIDSDTLLSRVTSTIDGCDSIIEVFVDFVPTIVVDTVVIIEEGSFFDFGERTLTKPGFYTETFMTKGTSCDSIVNLTLEYITGLESVYALPLVIAPNPIKGGEITYINRSWSAEEQRGLRIEVIDAQGEVVMSDYPTEYPIVVVGLNVRGVYLVRIVSGTGDVYVGKLVVN